MREFFRFWLHALRHSFNVSWLCLGAMSTLSPVLGTVLIRFVQWHWVRQCIRHQNELQTLIFILVLLIYLAWAPYRLYRELQQTKAQGERNSDKAEASLKMEKAAIEQRLTGVRADSAAAIQDLQKQLQEALDTRKTKVEEETKIDTIAANYVSRWETAGQPLCKYERMDILVSSGVGELESIPAAADRLIAVIRQKGAPDPLSDHWLKNRLFDTARWVVKQREHAEGFKLNEDYAMRYLEDRQQGAPAEALDFMIPKQLKVWTGG